MDKGRCVTRAIRALVPGLFETSLPDGLSAIRLPHVRLAVWHRDAPTGLRADLAGAAQPAALGLEGDLEDAVSRAATALSASGHSSLARDVEDLTRLFASVVGAGMVRIRLEHVDDNGCSRFHADAVASRLLCTYVGPGTEWLASAASARVRRIPTLAVGLLRGRHGSGGEHGACLHRSPPIAGRGISRLLLAVDTLCEPRAVWPG